MFHWQPRFLHQLVAVSLLKRYPFITHTVVGFTWIPDNRGTRIHRLYDPVERFLQGDVFLNEMFGVVDGDELFHHQDRPEEQPKIQGLDGYCLTLEILQEKHKGEKHEDKFGDGIAEPKPRVASIKVPSSGQEDGVQPGSTRLLELQPAPWTGEPVPGKGRYAAGAQVLASSVLR